MATHFSPLAWRIPRTEEPGGLQSMGSQRVGYDRSSRAHTRTYAGTWLHWDYRHDPGPSSPLIPSATLLLSIVACSQSESSEPSCKALGRWEHQEFTGRPHFIALQIQGYFFFKQIEGLWQLWIKQVYQHHFSNSICSLCLSVSHFGNFSTISQCFHYYCTCYGDLWLVTFDITITERLWLAKVQIFF